MLAYQISANYVAFMSSACAKIVEHLILVQFLSVSRNYTYFLANKSSTFDNFGISRCHTLTLFALPRI